MKHYKLNGTAVAALREAAGISQAELAERCEISAPYLSQIENGLRQPSPPVVRTLARRLGVKQAEIMQPIADGEPEAAAS